jgi:hypothetical protein
MIILKFNYVQNNKFMKLKIDLDKNTIKSLKYNY